MNTDVLHHLWQSTLFVMVAALLAVAFRKHGAHVRHWIWFAASLKFLVPFGVFAMLGSSVEWTPPQRIAASPVAAVMEQVAYPISSEMAVQAPTDGATNTLAMLWACGVLALIALRLRDAMRVRAVLRASAPLDLGLPVPVRSAPGLLEPGVVGLWRPVLLLPADIEQHLTPPQLEAVIAHELAHVRRRDNLLSSIHMVAEILFWFHPLVWWIGARLIEERERACDEAVLSLGGEPRIYADGILNVCKLYTESPLACVSGVSGADLRKRLEAIMTNPTLLRLTATSKAALAVVASAVMLLPIALGLSQAQSSPKFEVASIKPSGNCDSLRIVPQYAPGQFIQQCISVSSFIQAAYVWFETGRQGVTRSLPLEGGPDWVRSELYDINAIAEGNALMGTMRGPMMRALLEERFRLKIRKETREVPVYFLTVDRGGPKLPRHDPATCTVLDMADPKPREAGAPPPCQTSLLPPRPPSSTARIEVQGRSVEEFAKLLTLIADRPVIDRTGIAGAFDFRVQFLPDTTTPGQGFYRGTPGDPASGAVFSDAIEEQLGLKLERGRGPGEFLVIDHIERPSEN